MALECDSYAPPDAQQPAAAVSLESPKSPLSTSKWRSTTGLGEIYAGACQELRCKCNGAVRRQFELVGHPYVIPELDLSRNLIGAKGLLAVLFVLRVLPPGLRRVCVARNDLTDASLHSMCDTLRTSAAGRSTIECVDVSGNPLVRACAPLLRLAQECPTLVEVAIEGTHIHDGGPRRGLEQRLGLNRAALDARLRAAGLLPRENARPVLERARAEALLAASPCAAPGLHSQDPARAMLKHLRRIGRDFVDPELVPCSAPQARKACDIVPKPLIWPDLLSAESLRLRPGATGMQWFAQVVSELVREREEAARQLLSPAVYNPHGCMSCRFCCDGSWRYCVFDDLIPCDGAGAPAFLELTDGTQPLWPFLLLRAAAKRLGGYNGVTWAADVPLRSAARLAASWTGGLCLTRGLRSDKQGDRDWWQWLSRAKRTPGGIAFLSVAQGNERAESAGLGSGRAYAVRGVHGGASLRLALLSDPFGAPRWKGDWSDGDASWCSAAGLWVTLGCDRKPSSDFWVDWSTVCDLFDAAGVVFPDPASTPGGCEARGAWDDTSAGGPPHSGEWHTNPCWEMRVERRGAEGEGDREPVAILLALALTEQSVDSGLVSGIDFHILRDCGGGVAPLRCEPDLVVAHAGPGLAATVLWQGELPQGRYYVVPSTVAKDELAEFRLMAAPDESAKGARLRLRRIPPSRGWRTDELPTRVVPCAPPPRFADADLPQYELLVPSNDTGEPLEVILELSGKSRGELACQVLLSTTFKQRLLGEVGEGEVFAQTPCCCRSSATLALRLPAGRYVVLGSVGPQGVEAELTLRVWSRPPGATTTAMPPLSIARSPPSAAWQHSTGWGVVRGACVHAVMRRGGAPLPAGCKLLLRLEAKHAAAPLVCMQVYGHCPEDGGKGGGPLLCEAPLEPFDTSCVVDCGVALRTVMYVVCTLLPPDLTLAPCQREDSAAPGR
eukprot:TRINITY_DN6062_c0_g1_i1.p1 TRINITY_DN6062_c0_g1~~TRINITY_DN6062_c0_g1_i1.p1  ORF type:complete len:979 (+),score=247.69 TRINITY_DN6062_c0_g1_i1:81-2939(+)